MEGGEKSPLRLLDEAFHPILQAEPLELDRDEFIARHNRLDFQFPVGADERPATRLLGLELDGVLGFFVIARLHRIIGNVNVDDFPHLELIGWQLVNLEKYSVLCPFFKIRFSAGTQHYFLFHIR